MEIGSRAVGATKTAPPMFYPAPDIKWYPNAEQHPSIFLDSGLEQPAGAAKSSAAVASSASRDCQEAGCRESFVVLVECAEGLEVSDDAAHRYYVTAYCQGEPQEAINSRRSAPVLATPGADVCTLNQRVIVPYDSRQQFVKVALYRIGVPTDMWLGDASVPIADPRVLSASEWPIVREGEICGMMTLSVEFPEPAEPAVAAVAAADATAVSWSDAEAAPRRLESVAESLVQGAGSTQEVGSGKNVTVEFVPGDQIWVWSKLQSTWLEGVVDHGVVSFSSLVNRAAGSDSTPGRKPDSSRGARLPAASPERSEDLRASDLPAPAASGVTGTARQSELMGCRGERPSREVSAALDFTKGERIQVWSKSRAAWLDGVVEEVFVVACASEGYAVPAGTVKVASAAGRKWVTREEAGTLLRKREK